MQAVLNHGEHSSELATSIDCCREKLALEPAILNPAPLLGGNDLAALGLSPGPQFKSVLQSVRDMQLDGELRTSDEAREWVSRTLGL